MSNQEIRPDNLEDAINFYSVIMDTDPNGIFIYSPEGFLIECNQAACQMHGFTKHEMLNMPPTEFIHADGYQTFLDFKKALQEHGWFRGESVGRTRENGKFEVEVYGRIFRVNGTDYLYSTIRDITKEKLNLRSLQEAKDLLQATTSAAQSAKIEAEKAREEAEAANKAKSAFLTNMSHELRTPIAAMLASLECLKFTDLASEEKDLFLDILFRNCDHLTNLIDDLLDLSKVESGKLSLKIASIDIKKALSEVVDTLAAKAQKKGVYFTLEMRELTVSYINSDVMVVRQILLNLVGNAIKFTDSGGSVFITPQFTKGIGDEVDGVLNIFIKDTGCGIAADDYDKLFKSFSQVDSTYTRKHGGSGLGLVLSRNLAQSLGGDVTLLKSVPGRGSEFLVSLPSKALGDRKATLHKPPIARRTTGLASNRLLGGRVILVVEDDQDIGRAMICLLELAGAEVVWAENGQEGCDAAHNRRFDVVLMDMKLPILDGYEATTKLRASGYKRPIIAVTAHSTKEEKEKCLKSGCNDFMSKPVDSSQLIALIKHYCKE